MSNTGKYFKYLLLYKKIQKKRPTIKNLIKFIHFNKFNFIYAEKNVNRQA